MAGCGCSIWDTRCRKMQWNGFAKHAAPPLKSIGTEAVQGWVGGRHLLDVPITEDNAVYGGYLRWS